MECGPAGRERNRVEFGVDADVERSDCRHHVSRRTARRIEYSREVRVHLVSSAFALATAIATAASPAHAEGLGDMVSLRFEGGLGSMLSAHQREVLGYSNVDGWAGIRMGALFWNWFGVQISGVTGFYPSDQGLGLLVGLTGGVRVEPVIPHTPLRILLDLNAGPGWTGTVVRPALEAGLGIEFIGRFPLAVGLSGRYVHLFQDPSDPFPADAMSLFGVLHFTIRMPPHRTESRVEEAPRARANDHAAATPTASDGSDDLDGDGVIDMLDLCPDVPMGSLRDPRRLGCPRPDGDHDGVPDSEDACPARPPGAHPEPQHSGCPEPDGDHDGVADRYDTCVDEAAGFYPDAERGGCPRPDRDHDLVPDNMDRCADRAGTPDRRAARNGCPAAIAFEGFVVRFNTPWTFLPNESVIPNSVHTALNAVVLAVRALPPARVLVSVSRRTATAELTRARAQALVDYYRERRVDVAIDDAPPDIAPDASDGTPMVRVVPAN
jgi:hypothetical protein